MEDVPKVLRFCTLMRRSWRNRREVGIRTERGLFAVVVQEGRGGCGGVRQRLDTVPPSYSHSYVIVTFQTFRSAGSICISSPHFAFLVPAAIPVVVVLLTRAVVFLHCTASPKRDAILGRVKKEEAPNFPAPPH